uniref:Lipocalin n=1 Tax=Rhipicephalus zambeziensis TaxID=60191 RepID=A0A224YEC6_9ACAR
MRKHVFVALFLLFVAGKTNTMRCCFPIRRRHVYRIKQFVNCPGPIWTYSTSRPTRIRCQYVQMRTIDPLTIFFNRTFLINGQRHSMQLRGDFDLRHTDTMDVRTLDTACYYDLRVKNSSIERMIDAKCWRHFYTVARQETHVYTPACQRDVRPRK